MQKHPVGGSKMDGLFVSIGEAARFLNYSTTWLKQHEHELGLTPKRTGGGFRRYEISQLLTAADVLEGRRQTNVPKPSL
jgi:DNA-binding transcriptional MerR regulator